MTVIAGGFSRLMLDVRWTGGHGVVRIEQDGMFATEGRREASVMRILRARGYPVPAIMWEEPDPGVLGHPFFVMEFVDGRARTDDEGPRRHAAGRSPSCTASARRRWTRSRPSTAFRPAASRSRRSTPSCGTGTTCTARPSTYPIPLLERGFAWLRANLRATGPSVIVHGDPGPGNALQDDDGVAAVIDWELAHAGDAAEDWAYLALIRGRRLGSPQSWKARLAATVGVTYDEPTWRAWEAFNSVKGACVNLTALDVFRRTTRPTPDLLAIGVAVHLRFLSRAVELTSCGTQPAAQ